MISAINETDVSRAWKTTRNGFSKFLYVIILLISLSSRTDDNDELEILWTEAIVSQVRCYSRICLEGLKKITQSLGRDSPCPEGLPNSSREPYYKTSLFGCLLFWANLIICCSEPYKLNAVFYLPLHPMTITACFLRRCVNITRFTLASR